MCNCTSEEAPLGAGPESILPMVVMDSGLALRAPRNDGHMRNRALDCRDLLKRIELSARRANHFVFSEMLVQPLLQKYFPSRLTQISSLSRTVSSHRGAIARRHERGAGCGGRGSVRRCQGMAGRVIRPVS
jgi:hypothetical protein